MANTETLSDKAVDLILRFEIGGSKKYYEKYLSRPSWPGGASGVTIGIGVDLGYEDEMLDELEGVIPDEQIKRLRRTVGRKGTQGKAAIAGVRDIVIPWDFALAFFEKNTLPKYIAQTLKAFPNSEYLPDDAFGALVSIVFNRGPLIDNSDRRREMKEIKRILALGGDQEIDNEDLLDIAKQVRSMARLWADNKNSDGDLHDRRHAEADLIEESIS
jgi:hypothetical protein